jgi:hypothetical protein
MSLLDFHPIHDPGVQPVVIDQIHEEESIETVAQNDGVPAARDRQRVLLRCKLKVFVFGQARESWIFDHVVAAAAPVKGECTVTLPAWGERPQWVALCRKGLSRKLPFRDGRFRARR